MSKGKVKIRCSTCGKWFQSANAKDTTCPECAQKARKEKAAAKNASSSATSAVKGPGQGAPAVSRPVPPPPAKAKPQQGTTGHWLDQVSDVKVAEVEPPKPKLPPAPPAARSSQAVQERRDDTENRPSDSGNYRDRDERGPRPQQERGPNYREGNRGPGGYRGPGSYHVSGGAGFSGTLGQRPRQPMEGIPGRGPRPTGPGEGRQDRPPRPGGKPGGQKRPKANKPVTPPKPQREKIPPPQPFKPTDEQIAQVENRYLELAQPAEYDGIRSQIAKELGIPKTAVKKIIKDLRDRQHIPSWWELQTYKGSEEELAQIRTAYEPLLPVPEVGVHKKIAEQLNLKPAAVYQAIKLIRQELNLPQYNDPELHPELAERQQKKAKQQEEQQVEQPVAEAQAVAATESTEQSTPATSEAAHEEVPVSEAKEAEEGSPVASGAEGVAKE